MDENTALVIGEAETALFAVRIGVLDVKRDGAPAGRVQDPECEVAAARDYLHSQHLSSILAFSALKSTDEPVRHRSVWVKQI